MPRPKKECFILQLPLITERFQEDILNKRMEIGRQMYNALAGLANRRFREMIKTKVYRQAFDELKILNQAIKNGSDKEKKKALESQRKMQLDVLNKLRDDYRISKNEFEKDVKAMQHHFKSHIDSFTAQKLALHLWQAYEKMIFGDGTVVHFKKYDTLNSLEGKSNKTGIRFKGNRLIWNGLDIPVRIDDKNPYEVMSLSREVAYCRIVRKFVRGRYKFYLQLVLKGLPPAKYNSLTGEFKHFLGSGDVGIDIGTQTVAVSAASAVLFTELADRIQSVESQKRKILRKMDRSRRAMNPDNYNPDGTIKKQGSKKVIWNLSNRYKCLKGELKDSYRKQADIRKLQHEQLANQVLSLGDTFYVETMSFKGLQKRGKFDKDNQENNKDKNGKNKRLKRFGKSLANKAPSMFLSILKRKLGCYHRDLTEIDTWSAKASQFNHIERSYKKKKLSKRWNDFNGLRVQRDMYSAFLIMNIRADLKQIDDSKCESTFDNFMRLHDLEVTRLKVNKNLSSMAI